MSLCPSEMALFDHISLGVSSLERSAAFYDAVLDALGYVRLYENVRSICYGPPGLKGEAPFAIIKGREDATPPGPGFHLAFAAASRGAVNQFHKSALETGGVDEGPPGIREHYDPGYYAAFVRDPDGHRLEA